MSRVNLSQTPALPPFAPPPVDTPITSIAELCALEEFIDTLESCPGMADAAKPFRAKVTRYLKANPALLDKPWVRLGGAVFDLLEQLREARLVALETSPLSLAETVFDEEPPVSLARVA